MTIPTVDQQLTEADKPEYTGGMIALVPTEEDAARLAVDGGNLADRLHLTLAYLGDDVTGWEPAIVDAVHEVARKLTDRAAELAGDESGQPVPAGAEEEDYRGPGQRGPLTLHIFSHSHFNPNGGPDDQKPCMVYQFSGEGDLGEVESLSGNVCYEVKDAIGEVNFPEQHARFTPHVTAGYNLPPDALSYTGPVSFDRLRVVLADQVTDYPLGGTDMEEITAAVARTPGGSVSTKARESAKRAGHAMSDGSFPIEDGTDLHNAIQSVGLGGDSEAARRHIIKQAKRLKLESKIPETWKADGTVTASAELDLAQREVLTAAAGALVDKLGPVDAYGIAPQVFRDTQQLAFVDSLITLPDVDDALTAAAAETAPPPSWYFDKPDNLPPVTGICVEGDRVYGRLGEWDKPHIGMNGQVVYIPRSPSGYRRFHVKNAEVTHSDGKVGNIKVGHITFGTGHAPKGLGRDHVAAAAHYDHSGHRGARIRVYDDDPIGPVYAGALVPGLAGPRKVEFTESDTSGDWRAVMGGPLDLVAVGAVNVGAFPKVDVELAASGEPVALIASASAWGNSAAVLDVEVLAAAVVGQMERRSALNDQRASLLSELNDDEDRLIKLLVQLYWDEIDVDEPTDDLTADAVPSRMPPQLQQSYIAGKVAQRIRWGIPGDFKRCVAQAKIHGMGHKAEGACATLHHKALGAWPGREHGKK